MYVSVKPRPPALCNDIQIEKHDEKKTATVQFLVSDDTNEFKFLQKLYFLSVFFSIYFHPKSLEHFKPKRLLTYYTTLALRII